MGMPSVISICREVPNNVGAQGNTPSLLLTQTVVALGDRVFYMELSKIEFGKDIDQAVCTKSVGDAPAQMLNFDELMSKAPIVEATDDFNEDFYGNDGYNEDDIDPEGYGIGDIADISSIDDLY